ncbi:MAG: DUF1648 domain-containing protein [Clostridiaceae bacterium]|jgi:uncharacterized membrane protein|nr:DUF1648 domain-containing protein [Clostridiaceae bacterium]
MKNKRSQGILWVAAILPLIMVAAVWTRLPEQVPLNWGIDGTISYGGRATLWGLAVINPLIVLLMTFAPRVDPREENYQKFKGPYTALCLAVVLLMDAVMLITLAESLRPGTVNVYVMVQLMVAVLMMVIGNMMPKFRQTWFCGIKNAWTLSSERVWTRTHRLGGRLYFAAGAAMVVGAFFPPRVGFVLMVTVTVAVTLVATVMSYVWFRQEQAG